MFVNTKSKGAFCHLIVSWILTAIRFHPSKRKQQPPKSLVNFLCSLSRTRTDTAAIAKGFSYHSCFYTSQLRELLWSGLFLHHARQVFRCLVYSLYAIYQFLLNLESHRQRLCHHNQGFCLLARFYIPMLTLTTVLITVFSFRKGCTLIEAPIIVS